MLTVSLDHNIKKSLYIQLYESIKEQIIKKVLKSNSRLPSKRALSMHLGVSIKTVENAYSQLLLEGYIISRERQGFDGVLWIYRRFKGDILLMREVGHEYLKKDL